VPVGHAVHRRGDLGGHGRSDAVGALRRRGAASLRRRRRNPRVGRQGPRLRSRGLERISRGRRPRTRRLDRLLPGVPGDHRVTDALFDRADAPAEIRVFGIRHHGPGSARAVLQALAEFEPDTVLIEGPSDADPVLALAAADDMVPPVALLAYARDEPARAAFWPFAAFSPEWQALRWAYLHDANVRFCDLPAASSLAAESSVADRATGDLLGMLARAGGYADFEQWWDAVVEHGTAQAFGEITDAMRVLREDVGIDDHTARREAHMRQVL